MHSTFPAGPPGGAEWHRVLDKLRAARGAARASLGFTAGLIQVRMDWAGLKQVFAFPSWSSSKICWLCKAGKDATDDMSFTNFSMRAAWRKNRYVGRMFFSELRRQGVAPSSLFACPGFLLSYVLIDCLHALDLGVTQDIIANIFWECLGTVCVGRNRKIQVECLKKG